MFWQSSVLVLVLLALDFGLRHRVRAAVRHGLWLVLLVKLVLPTDLALPTSPAWWWSRANAVPVLAAPVVAHNYVVTQTDVLTPDISAPDWVEPPPVRPALTLAAGSLLLAGVVSLGLLGWLLWRWRQVVRASRAALPDAELALRLGEARELTRLRSPVPVRLTQATMSPAVCGLFRPVILLPRALAETLAPEQLRAVLLHELMHVRRGDVWVNLAQSLLQIFYWWHPLVWLANARIRRVREEAVDEAVMVALRGEADIYAPTLLAVAKFALHRPRLSLGLLGIMESRSALRQRIERLVTLPVPRRAGLGVLGALGIVAFSAVALPMGEAPPLPPQPAPKIAPATALSTSPPTKPRPLISYILMAETGLPKLRQETGLTADSPPADYLAAFNKLLAASGNALPSNSLWLGDQGILLVRAEPAELGALGHLFRDLNGPDPSAGSRSASATPSAPVRSTAVASLSAPPAVADTNLFMRTFKINTNIFYTAVQKALGTNVPVAPKALADSLRDLFGRFGVDLARPKALLYNDRLGLLFVKATGEDLQVIERVAESLDEPTAEQRRLLRMATPLNHSNGVVGAGIPAPAQAGGSPEMNTQEPAITYQPDAAGNPGATSLPASGLVQDGKLLYEMGKLAEAEAKLTEALKLDPNNVAAFYYLNLIQQAQFAHSVTNQISSGRQAILHKLESIRLDTLNVDGLPLSEVLRQISEQAKLHDPEKKGINFLINPHTDLSATSTATLDPATGLPLTAAAAAPADQVDVGSTVIKFHLAEVRLADVLDAIVLVAERPIKYSIQDYAVVFSPKSPDATDLYSRTFKISVDDLRQGLGIVGPIDTLHGKSPTEAALEQLRVYLSAQGVNLSPPKALFYNGRLGLLFVKASETDLDVVEKVVESWLRVTVPPPPLRPDLHSVDKMVDSWSNPAPAPSGPTSQEAATVTATNAPDVNQLMIDAMTLYESGHGDEARLKLVQVLRQDPANPAALYYWRLVHASHPAAAETNLFLRTFKVSPGLWESALAFPGETNFVITALRAGRFGQRLQLYLHFLGVEVVPPKSAFYNDRLGLLFVKATAADLDKVEQAISQLSNTNTPPGTSSFQLSSPTTTNNTALGFTWYASQFGSNLLPQTATSPAPVTITGILSNPNFQAAINALKQRSGVENLPEPEVTTTSGRQAHMRGSVMAENVFAAPMLDVPIHNRPQLHIKAYFIEVTGDVANPPALAHPPTGPNEAAIVAGDQIHPWLHQLETRPGTEILGEPEVTTTSDRQTQMRATEIMSVVAGVNPKALTPPGMTRAEVTNGPGFFVVQKVECGPIFDVVPQVMADGCTIHLRILATANEFEGYDKPTEKVRVYVDDLPTNGPPATTTVPAPRFDERAFRASVNLYDSQALMLTLPIDPRTGLPLEKAGKKAKHLLVLATVSIVDPAGNRVHADDELPFAHDHVPPQPVESETRLDDRPFLRPTVPVRP